MNPDTNPNPNPASPAPIGFYTAVMNSMTAEERAFFETLPTDAIRLAYIGTILKKAVPANSPKMKLEIKPPRKYDGVRDAVIIGNFVYQVKQYYASTEATPVQVQATFHERLADDALTWYRLRLQRCPLTEMNLESEWSIDSICAALRSDFEPKDRDKTSYKQLCALKFGNGGNLKRFITRFQTLALNVRIETPTVTEAEVCNRFREKLEAYEEGFIQCPDSELDTLDKLVKVAFDWDRVLRTRQGNSKWKASMYTPNRSYNHQSTPTTSFSSALTKDDPMDVDINKLSVPAQRALEQKGINTNLKTNKLSDDEKQKHLREGLCFKCHQKGHLSKHCPVFRKN